MRNTILVVLMLCLPAAVFGKIDSQTAKTPVTAVIDQSDYGSLIKSGNPKLTVWWCEGAWKVGTRRPAPELESVGSVYIEAAGNEYEPVQIVLNAKTKGMVLTGASVSDLKGKTGRIPSARLKLYEVATVPVKNPSDNLGKPGAYPDPLPPLKTPLKLPASRNQAIWAQVYVPADTPAGNYDGKITFRTNRGTSRIPIRVHVFGFTLPKATHLRSAFGLDAGNISAYHNLTTEAQKRKQFDLYARSFAAHRVSPSSFSPFDSIGVRFAGQGDAKRVVVDFAGFDRAARKYLDGMHFNSFRLRIEGLGGSNGKAAEFGGFKAGTPQYDKLWGSYISQVEAHLKKNGWLDKALCYWIEEPTSDDYQSVLEGMDRIKKHAPGINRLLTSPCAPYLYGHVDIWSGKTKDWNVKLVAQRKADGEDAWWYIGREPKAPYIGEFIEHPAVEMRLWPWQSWQYGVNGIMVWDTVWWSGKDASLQNPWKDAASCAVGGVAEKTQEDWANGDGRFYYPPRVDPKKAKSAMLSQPISSIRFENLRDGMEDYEYLYMLNQYVERMKEKASPELLDQARRLLQVPSSISRDLTHFSSDPRPLLAHRAKVAGMIEKLQKKAK